MPRDQDVIAGNLLPVHADWRPVEVDVPVGEHGEFTWDGTDEKVGT